MMKVNDRYKMLVVVELLPNRRARCICDCGKEAIVWRNNITRENTASCGCVRSTMYKTSHPSLTHGHTKGVISPTYRTWVNMIARCHIKSSSSWDLYGAKGIYVCDRWREDFKNFLEDMGEKPIGYSIDRIDNKKGYSLANCRWASVKDQARNRSNNRLIEFDGNLVTLAEISERTGINRHTLSCRIKRFGSLSAAIDSPFRKGTKFQLAIDTP